MEFPCIILARGGTKPKQVQCLRSDHGKQSVCLGDIWDRGVREMWSDGAVIANPGKEQTRGNESVEFEVYGEKALLKGAELSLCCSGCDE